MAEQPARPLSTLRVTGTSVVAAHPDRVEIDIGVVTQAPEASAAAADNARHLQATLAALRKVLGEHADLKTLGYGLSPDYAAQPGNPPTISGYTASNTVRVTIDDIAKTGPVIDAATRSGANHVQDIRFTLRDPQTPHLQALREAATQARADADALAEALGVRIVRVLSAEESGGSPRPIRPLFATARAAIAAAPTPVEAGTLDVTATVTLTVEVSP